MIAATETGMAIGVRYLTGYAVAALPTGAPEWPPHPARLFMALVAACHEMDGETKAFDALRWLEQQASPEVVASSHDDRQAVTVYVPPNDFSANDLNIVPQWRTKRQPRTFPRVRPHDDVVYFIWPAGPDDRHVQALQRLCANVTRLGHSSSLVQVWLHNHPVEQGERHRYQPGASGELRLRNVNPGTLDYLAECYRASDVEDHFCLDAQIIDAKGKAKREAQAAYEQRFGRAWVKNTPPERLRPEMSAAVAYERVMAGEDVQRSCFDSNLVVLRLSPRNSRFRRLAAATSPRVCDVFRKAMVKHARDGLEVVTGHAADGSPLQAPHLAVMPLPYVGGRHGDGHVLGVAAVLPKGIGRADLNAVLRAIADVEDEGITLGDLGVWNLSTVRLDDDRYTLRSDTWTATQARPAACWATVTPIALDRHPKAKSPLEQQDELAHLIRRACTAIDVPEPARVVPLPVSVFGGVPDAGRYPRLARKDGSKRRQTHAILWFDKPVVGPVLLGAGRFRGWGVCRPYKGGKA